MFHMAHSPREIALYQRKLKMFGCWGGFFNILFLILYYCFWFGFRVRTHMLIYAGWQHWLSQRNTQHGRMRSHQTPPGFLSPRVRLDGRISKPATPRSVSCSRKPELKGQISTSGVRVSGAVHCTRTGLSRGLEKTTTPPHCLCSHASNPGARNENHLISLSMLRTTNFGAVDLTMLRFLTTKAISAAPSPQC